MPHLLSAPREHLGTSPSNQSGNLRRTTFTHLEPLLLLSASPVAELDVQHVDDGDAFDTLLSHENHSPFGSLFSLSSELNLSGRRGDHHEVDHVDDLALREGTIDVSFTADDVSGRHALFSKDHQGKGAGDLTAFVQDGRLAVLLQSAKKSVWLKTAEDSIQEAQEHRLTVTFGDDGFWVYLDGEAAAWKENFTQGLEHNDHDLIIGANTWMRNARRPDVTRHGFDGQISEFTVHAEQFDASQVASGGCEPTEPNTFSLDLDFGTSFSPQAEGFERVTSGTTYSEGLGYGWTSGTIRERDRGSASGDELTQDFNYTALGTFDVDLANQTGTYDVTITLGDGSLTTPVREQMGIYLEGELVDTVTTQPGEFVTSTYTVDVSDGQLNMTFEDLGGSGQFVIINSIQISSVDTQEHDTCEQLPPEDEGEDTTDNGTDTSNDDKVEKHWITKFASRGFPLKSHPFLSKFDFTSNSFSFGNGWKLGLLFKVHHAKGFGGWGHGHD